MPNALPDASAHLEYLEDRVRYLARQFVEELHAINGHRLLREALVKMAVEEIGHTMFATVPNQRAALCEQFATTAADLRDRFAEDGTDTPL